MFIINEIVMKFETFYTFQNVTLRICRFQLVLARNEFKTCLATNLNSVEKSCECNNIRALLINIYSLHYKFCTAVVE